MSCAVDADASSETGVTCPLNGNFFPRDYELEWSNGVRTFFYLVFLIWCFSGIMVVSDLFMAAIERITSKRARRLNPETGRFVTYTVWNPTVANLSLMALGSSAPEILLAVIELLGNNMYAGALGPSTIVGSAAFNLFCIIAVCVLAIPEGEVRYIKETQVYTVTASFSIFAYVWLVLILTVISPNVVEIWEGALTLLFFPMLLILAFLADRGMLPGTLPADFGHNQIVGMTKEELAERRAAIQQEHRDTLTEEQVTKLLMVEGQQKNYAQHRVAAMRALVGGKPVVDTSATAKTANLAKVMPVMEVEEECTPMDNMAFLEFRVMKMAILESAGTVDVVVMRHGALENTVSVDYATRDGTAKKGSDFEHMAGTLLFPPGVKDKTISVKIIDDIAFEEDEEFYVDLSNPKVVAEDSNEMLKPPKVEIGHNGCLTIVIIDDDLPGVLAFPEEQISVQEEMKDWPQKIIVSRKNGGTGEVTCQYKTEDASAIADVDYKPTSGELRFGHGETQKAIDVVIKARGRYDKTEMFRIVLTDAGGGAKFDANTDGGEECCILSVMIETNQESKKQTDRIMSNLQSSWDKSKVGHANWAEQFKDAIYVLGGEEEDEDGNPMTAGIGDWIMHFVTLPWKLVFALVPPTDYCGGWLAFFCSLGMIGLVTALVGDLAALFGCMCGWPDEITAITIVALGTSLPDTFASKAAAEADPHADASVGNVTGSNSVNVFLGIGLPWLMGAIYWNAGDTDSKWVARYTPCFGGDIDSQWDKGAFVVLAGSLSISVAIYSACAVICIMLLALRRKFFGGELGGPQGPKYASAAFLVCLWFIYVAISGWYATTD